MEHVVVVAVLQGRYFPKRLHHYVVLEAQLDSKVLQTNAVQHLPDLEIQNELAWVLDRQTFQYHRMHRTPIKLRCLVLDQDTGQREEIGYLMLDLRSAQQTQTGPKWMPLLNCSYRRAKPEIKIGMSLEVKQPSLVDPPAAPRLEPVAADGRSGSEGKSAGEVVVGAGGDRYELEVQLSDSGALSGLLAAGGGTTPEECQIRILGLPCVLETRYFAAARPQDARRKSMKAVLRSRPHALAQTLLNASPLTVEITARGKGQEHLVATGDLDVGRSLAAISDQHEATGEADVALIASVDPAAAPDAVVAERSTLRFHLRLTRLGGSVREPQATGVASHSLEHEDTHAHERRGGRDVEHGRFGEDGDSDAESEESRHTHVVDTSGDDRRKEEPQTEGGGVGIPAARSAYTEALDVPRGARKFTCSIDLRTIRRHTTVPHTLKLYIAYRYAALGTPAPIMTHPPVELAPRAERQLPAGFTSFELTATYDHLMDAFVNQGVLLEVHSTDQVRGHEQLGQGLLHMDELFRTPPVATPVADRAYTAQVPVDLTDERGNKLVTVNVHLTLEDRGPDADPPALPGPGGGPLRTANRPPPALPGRGDALLGDVDALLADSSTDGAPTGDVLEALDNARARDSAAAATGSGALPRRRPATPPTPTTPPPARAAGGGTVPEGMLQRAALDLELWMRQEQARFEERLEAKEKAVLRALSEEWRGRLREREALLQRKVAAYGDMEGKLRSGLRELQLRETQAAERETRLERRERALQDEHARALADMRDASRRLEQDFEHQLELHERRAQAREDELRVLRRDRAKTEERLQRLQAEADALRQAQASGPGAQLQAHAVELGAQVHELQRRLAHASKAKAQYKQQWKRALQALARQRQKEQLAAKEHMRREQRELEHMRLQYLAQEERQLAGQERSQLEGLRRQVAQLQALSSDSGHTPAQGQQGQRQAAPTHSEDVGGAGGSQQQEQELARLMEERQTLLNAGIYTPDDTVIHELDRRISTLLPAVGLTA